MLDQKIANSAKCFMDNLYEKYATKTKYNSLPNDLPNKFMSPRLFKRYLLYIFLALGMWVKRVWGFCEKYN